MANTDENLERMQQELGYTCELNVVEFENFAKTQKLRVIGCEPSTLSEIQAVIRAAKKHKLRVRCAGVGHSWAPIFPDQGNILLRLQKLRRDDGPNIQLKKEPGHNYVTVMAAVTMGELRDFGLEHKINLPTNVILPEVTCAGVVATGCHGTGWNCNAISDYVTEMRIVDSDGILRHYSKAKDSEMFRAIQTNLGLFGVIYDMTFDLPDEIIVKTNNDFHHKVGKLFYDPDYLKHVVTNNDYIEIFWLPFNSIKWRLIDNTLIEFCASHNRMSRNDWNPKEDITWVMRANQQKEHDEKELVGEWSYTWLDLGTFMKDNDIPVTDSVLIENPPITPLYMQASFTDITTLRPVVTQKLSHAIQCFPAFSIHPTNALSCSFNCADDFKDATLACQYVIDLVQEYAEQGKYPLNVAMEMRFIADSEAYLGAAAIGHRSNGGSGHCLMLQVLSGLGTPEWSEFCNKLLTRWRVLNPMVHWGKGWYTLEGATDFMKQVYTKQAALFLKQLNKSRADPTGMFRNGILEEILFNSAGDGKTAESFD